MDTNLTEIVCIIDRSGSMQSIKADAIGGFNSFVEEQRKVEGEARITVALFNHTYQLLFDSAPLADVALDTDNYVPSGTTALLDAVGRTVDDVGKRLSNTAEQERPGLVIVAILTDGMENASRDYNRKRIFDMIEHQRTTYNWQFLFLAANQDAIAAAKSIAINPDNAIAFQATGAGQRMAMKKQSARITKMRRKNNE